MFFFVSSFYVSTFLRLPEADLERSRENRQDLNRIDEITTIRIFFAGARRPFPLLYLFALLPVHYNILNPGNAQILTNLMTT